ncbi:UNVERIFIED_CONTAM: hypothetical protein RMT77_001431 [Armadillidium vulgare]
MKLSFIKCFFLVFLINCDLFRPTLSFDIKYFGHQIWRLETPDERKRVIAFDLIKYVKLEEFRVGKTFVEVRVPPWTVNSFQVHLHRRGIKHTNIIPNLMNIVEDLREELIRSGNIYLLFLYDMIDILKCTPID